MITVEFIQKLYTKHRWNHHSAAPEKATIYYGKIISPIEIW